MQLSPSKKPGIDYGVFPLSPAHTEPSHGDQISLRLLPCSIHLGVVLATAAQPPASMRTFLKAANFFREPAHQA